MKPHDNNSPNLLSCVYISSHKSPSPPKCLIAPDGPAYDPSKTPFYDIGIAINNTGVVPKVIKPLCVINVRLEGQMISKMDVIGVV